MGKLQGKVFLIQFLFLIYPHNFIQEFCGISLSFPCSVCIDIHGRAYVGYKEQVTKWEKNYGENSKRQNKKSMLERLKNLPKKTADYQQQRTVKSKDRGAR